MALHVCGGKEKTDVVTFLNAMNALFKYDLSTERCVAGTRRFQQQNKVFSQVRYS
jgi:hypothetical protein